MGRITMSNTGFQDFIDWASILKIPVLRRWRMPFASNLWRGEDFLLSVSITFQPLLRLLPFRVRDKPLSCELWIPLNFRPTGISFLEESFLSQELVRLTASLQFKKLTW
jgi:hypothetical protein